MLVVSRKSRRHISMWSLVLRKAGTHYEEVGIRRAVTGIEAGSKRSRGSWHVYLRVCTKK